MLVVRNDGPALSALARRSSLASREDHRTSIKRAAPHESTREIRSNATRTDCPRSSESKPGRCSRSAWSAASTSAKLWPAPASSLVAGSAVCRAAARNPTGQANRGAQVPAGGLKLGERRFVPCPRPGRFPDRLPRPRRTVVLDRGAELGLRLAVRAFQRFHPPLLRADFAAYLGGGRGRLVFAV